MWFALSVCCTLIFSVVGQRLPAVNIVQGTVVGSIADDGDYFKFYGIPYADSTSGSHRFKAPNPPPTFEIPFVANRKDVKCVRALGVGFEGTEDCLVADVFTPSIDSTRGLPVMVWIKGKEFDKVYEPELSFKHFIEKEVVIVSLNFRESILGFLCLGTETAPGNAGLKDIIAGLRWVQQNIEQFGGDPNNVSLFGHGSGAAAVDLVTMSPMAKGLVHKAIAQSGTALSPWAVTRDNLEYAVQVAEALGHIVTNIEQLSEVFTRTSIAALMAVINELDLTDNSLAFAPCLEKETLEGVEPFLVKSPFQTIVDGEMLQIPFMTGFVDNEGTIREEEAINKDWLERMDESFVDFLQPDLQFETEKQKADISQEIRSFYFDNSAVDIGDYIRYHGDTMMLVSTIREARLRAVFSTSPIYLYQFSYKGSLGEPFVGSVEVESAAHSEELGYLFSINPTENTSILDLTIGDILVERWTNFAKTGVPTSETSQVVWEPYTTPETRFLRILDPNELNEGGFEVSLQNPHQETVTFWDTIYFTHFLDAEGKWELTERIEDDSDEIEESGGGDDELDTGTGELIIVDSTESSGDEEAVTEENVEIEENGDGNSASKAMGDTFLIIVLITVLNNFVTYK